MNPENRDYFLRNRSLRELQVNRETVQRLEQQPEREQPPQPEQPPPIEQPPQVPVMEVTANVIKATVHLKPFSGDGQTAAKIWLQWFERYCALNKEPEGQILTFPIYLSNHARIWFESLTEEIKTDYPRLKAAFLERFENQDIVETELLEITQRPDECTNDYFSRVLKKAQHSNADQKLITSLAVKGLKARVKQIVIPMKSQTFEEA